MLLGTGSVGNVENIAGFKIGLVGLQIDNGLYKPLLWDPLNQAGEVFDETMVELGRKAEPFQ